MFRNIQKLEQGAGGWGRGTHSGQMFFIPKSWLKLPSKPSVFLHIGQGPI